MAKRTIAHAIFRYHDADGREIFAMRGETVELSAKDIAFGEKNGAFAKDAEAAENQTPPVQPPAGAPEPFPLDGDDDAQTAWMAKATIPQVMTEADRGEDVKSALLVAEQRRDEDARKTLLEALSK